MPVMIVQATSSHCVTAGQIDSLRATSSESARSGSAVQCTAFLAVDAIAGDLARTEPHVTPPLVTVRHSLFKRSFGIPVAVMIVDPATSHRLSTMGTRFDNTCMVTAQGGN